MAINPETRYTGKIAPSSTEYPYGQARNISLPGDGTGTPWEAALVNDIFGFQQALLSEAGEAPSGDPETATASQYLDAIKNILSRKHKAIEYAGGIPNDSSTAAKDANEAALASIEAENKQPLFTGGNDYYVNSGYDVWQHRFAAGRDTSLFIGATEYDISNSVWGIYRIDDFGAGQNDYITLRNSRDNIVIARIARGDNASASHVFQLPLDIRRDSHSFISGPGTAGGSSDILFRDNVFQDLHYIVNDTSTKKLEILFNTAIAPTYAFDVAVEFPTESTSLPIKFPRLPVQFATADFSNERAALPIARNRGGNPSLGVTKSNLDLPYTDEIIRADIYPAGSILVMSGTFEATFSSNTGVVGRKRDYFEWSWDGSVPNITVTSVLDTMPVEVTARPLIISGDRFGLQLDFDDTGASGSDCQISARIDASYSVFEA